MRGRGPLWLLVVSLLCLEHLAGGAQSQQPARDTSAQPPPPTGRITGRIVTADTGRPIKRARVAISARELPEGRAALTDEAGQYDLTDLPAGRYTLTVSKAGFIALSYGQRRPLQAGTPLQLIDGQQLKGVDFQLPRGGAIAGHVFDEDGEPIPSAIVRVLRYQYLQGDRRLVAVGTGQTDDKGQYRIWGLLPGEYYVSAVARGGRGAFVGRGGNFALGPGGFFAADARESGGEQAGYAPTFFPGAGSINEARPMTLGVSQEILDVDFGIQLVRTGRLSGIATNSDGSRAWSGSVNLTPEGTPMGANGAGGPLGTTYGGRIDWDGSFAIANVPPGRYTLRARSNDGDVERFAAQPLSVAGGDVSGVGIILLPGATITGTVTFLEAAAATDPTAARLAAPSADQSSFGITPTARVEKDGRFTISGVPSGLHYIRLNGSPRGWVLKAIEIDGREVTDTPVDVRSGQTLANVNVIFTTKIGEIDGTLTDGQGQPVTDFTILAFPTDQSLWHPQSRHIMTARPDQNGKFQIRGLPPAEYFVAPIDPAEQGEWFEPAFLDRHRQGAARLTLGEGDTKTQDFKVTR